ncbi:uncharacterized protein NESG_01059 [Nematocida ausubeli]|uniref:Uncharacterized protein n=1 Tax=Nematocida ausubeli (strain ATCC PRA-371 / ERTm2) TaxID=1913371 RepID=A0A086J435_NEMA1|nr:uncharacterized protein NESG_01059 [Nematocida ausubeli]KAI5132333.1 hypothetical protein NEAUS07_0095 [Nematocida ausubeli]KAI5147011.1 hypothetical protein NEAUS05_0343 [Nematocida ausubeli]KFG26903.1 hypothetical protein NESG_01059 [Nematocida ausubeli]
MVLARVFLTLIVGIWGKNAQSAYYRSGDIKKRAELSKYHGIDDIYNKVYMAGLSSGKTGTNKNLLGDKLNEKRPFKAENTPNNPNNPDAKKYTYEEKKQELIEVLTKIVNYIFHGGVPEKIKTAVSIKPEEKIFEIIDKAYIPWALTAMFIVGCNMAIYGIQYKNIHAFSLVWYYLFRAVHVNISMPAYNFLLNRFISGFVPEMLLEYIQTQTGQLVLSATICLALSVLACWVVSLWFRVVAMGSVLLISTCLVKSADVMPIRLDRLLLLIVCLIVLVLALYKFMHKNIENYIFICLFGFFSSLLIFLPLSEFLELGMAIPPILLNYNTDIRTSDISLTSEYIAIGLLMASTIIMQICTRRKKG